MVPLAPNRPPLRRRRRRDFSSTTHRAPQVVRHLSREYYHPPQPHAPRWVAWGSGLVLLVALVGLVYTPVFSIRNIIVDNVRSVEARQRVHDIVASEVTNTGLGFLPPSSLLFFSSTAARAKLGNQFVVDGLNFIRRWPNVLVVSFPKQDLAAVWRSGGVSFLADSSGLLVQQLANDSTPPPDLTLVEDGSAPPDKLGDTVATAEVMQFTRNLGVHWAEILPGVTLDHLYVDPTMLPTIQVHTGGGWYVLVSAETDLTTQLTAVARLLQDKVKDQQNNLEYIDVRFGNKLYLKTGG